MWKALHGVNFVQRFLHKLNYLFSAEVIHLQRPCWTLLAVWTIQLDVILPARLELLYSEEDGNLCHPVLLHRALLGNLERTVGILLEHHGALLPAWLAPEQIAVLPVHGDHVLFAQHAVNVLRQQNLRVNFSPEAHLHRPRLGNRMRESMVHAIPAIAVVGDNEVQENNLTVSINGSKISMSIDELAAMEQWKPPAII